MAKCTEDIRKDVIDEAKSGLPIGEGRFFRQQSNGDIVVSKARFQANPKQAYKIAESYVKSLNEKFSQNMYGQIASIQEWSDTLQVVIRPSRRLVEAYAKSYAETMSLRAREQSLGEVQQRTFQDFTALGINSEGDSDTSLFSTLEEEDYFASVESDDDLDGTEPPAVGTYKKYLEYKMNMLATLNSRLARIRNDKRRFAGDETKQKALNRLMADIENRIKGNPERGIIGIEHEISQLENNPAELAVVTYMDADLKRLEKLSKSSDPSDNAEAIKIINFISASGNFVLDADSGMWKPEKGNPFFDDTTSLYFEGAIQAFRNWRDVAKSYEQVITKRGEEFVTEQANADPRVRKLHPQGITYDTLTNKDTGLKDTNWIDMWIMDVTNGILSDNGIMPQIMLAELEKAIDEKAAYAREVEEKLNELTPKVQDILYNFKDANGNHPYRLSSVGILGIKAANYSLFKQRTEGGLDTGRLVNRYSDKFFRSREQMLAKYDRMYNDAKLEVDPDLQNRKFAAAFEQRKAWYLNNVHILDIRQMPEVINHPDLAGFSTHFQPSNSAAYKADLISQIGQAAYDEEVAKQIDQIKEYKLEDESFTEEYLAEKGKTTEADLSLYEKAILDAWRLRNNPFHGVEDYHSRNGLSIGGKRVYNFMKYNITIPRKAGTTVGIDTATQQYTFSNTGGADTGYWDDQFQKIEADPTLKEFHASLQDVFKTVRDNMPEDLYKQISVNNIPALKKAIIEILTDKNIPAMRRLIIAMQEFWNRIKAGLGIIKQGNVSYANIDVITGKPNYEVNDTFLKGNISKINDATFLEKQAFLQFWNAKNRNHIISIKEINRNTSIDLRNITTADEDIILKLAGYLHVEPNLQALRQATQSTNGIIPLSSTIKASVVHEIVQQQSFDLPKIAKYFATLTMEYAGRNQVLPAIQAMKEHYEAIQKPKLNNSGKRLINNFTDKVELDGPRSNALNQMNDWFNRVGLNNYTRQELGVAKGDEDTDKKETTKQRAIHYAKVLTGQKIDKKFLVGDEKKVMAHINDLLDKLDPKDPKNEETIAKLLKMKAGLGRTFSGSAAIENFLNFTRLRALGYNLSAGVTNFLDGWNSNMILASSGEFFPPEKIYKAYAIVRNNFLLATPSLGFAKTSDGKKMVRMMEKYRILQDSSNELQKSSIKTNFSWTRNLSPYELVRRVETLNQAPLAIAMLDSTPITDINGVKHESVWEALDEHLNLLPEFRTDENIASWEHMKGDSYHTMKGSLKKAIVRGHGNYDDKRGMMIKSSAVGKAMMMFKTWIPHALYSRLATEQVDLASGLPSYKGRFRSFTTGSGAVFGSIAALTMMGPLAAPVGLLAGAAMAKWKGASSDVGFLADMANTGLLVAKKMIGMPVNFIAGKEVIKSQKDYNNYLSGSFTEQDARNMKSNVADMAMLASWILMTILAKLALYDDEDEVDEQGNVTKAGRTTKRKWHNVLVNRFVQMINQAEMFINPRAMWNGTVGDLGIIKFYDDVKQTCKLANDYFNGTDTILTGTHAGESKFANQATKTFVPSMFRDGKALTLGFGSQIEMEMPETKKFSLNPYFRSDEAEAKIDVSEQRLEKRQQLEESGLDADDAKKQVNKQFGRRKKGESYKSYRQRLEASNPREE